MGLQTTPLTDIPLTPAGTIDQPTWGASNEPFAVPANTAVGYAGNVLTSEDVNYKWNEAGKNIRAQLDQQLLTTENFLASCILRQGAWNTNSGTRNVTLAPTRLVIDANGDGGPIFELYALAGSPEVLAPSTDNYVDLNESGAVFVSSVPNNDPEPAGVPGAVRIYKLVTDATELTSATLDENVLGQPCLASGFGFVSLVGGSLQVSTANIAALETGAADLFGITTIGEDSGDTLTVESTVTTEAGWTNNGIHVFAAEARFPAGVLFQVAAAPTLAGQTARTSSDELTYHNGDRLAAPSISVIELDDEAVGATSITLCETSNRVAAPVRLTAIFTGYISRPLGNGTITIQIEQTDAGVVWSPLGTSFVVAVLTTPTLVTMAAVRITDAVKRLYRVTITSGVNILADEARLEIRPG